MTAILWIGFGHLSASSVAVCAWALSFNLHHDHSGRTQPCMQAAACAYLFVRVFKSDGIEHPQELLPQTPSSNILLMQTKRNPQVIA